MRVKDLKALLDQLPDDAEVLVQAHENFKSATGYLSQAVCIVQNPTQDEDLEDAGLMACSDMREFITVSKSPRTPEFLMRHAVPVLVLAE